MRLKEMREKAGLTQFELSALSGVNLRSLQDYEQGYKSIRSANGETLLRLSAILGYTIEDILQDSTIQLEHDVMNHTAIVHFPIIVEDDAIDMSRIYPTKQLEVKKVVDQLRRDENVDELRLFGSSITMACHKDSDLDFAVGLRSFNQEICNNVSEIIQQCCNWKADIIWMDHLNADERIYTDIMGGLLLI